MIYDFIRPESKMESAFDSFSLLGYASEGESRVVEKWGKSCAFCFAKLESRAFNPDFSSEGYKGRWVNQCAFCGWWCFTEEWETCNTHHKGLFCGILQCFDLRSARTPLEVLELELPKWIEKIHHLNPQRMEDIVGRILASVWKCDVKHLGYTKDGGIDLLLLDSDTPVAVQVKRRSMKDRPEMVSGNREFLGAGLLSGMQRLMFVTTAERFTKGAVEAAHLSEQRLVEKFELVSMKEIRRFLPSLPNQNPWDFAVKRANNKFCEVPTIPDPYAIST